MTLQTPNSVDLRKYIETNFLGERSHIRGQRVPVATIAYSAKSQRWDIAELARQFTLTEAETLAALLYYQEHESEIDAQEAVYQSQLDEAYRIHSDNQ
jgi:uncharacterized protein (DUF433 family)